MPEPSHPAVSDPLDEFVDELLECGAALSQIISHMVESRAAGRSDPGLAPIPEIAHGVIRDVLDGVRTQHSKRDIRVAAAIVGEATEAIVNDIFFVDPPLN
jgi:hypothetical protein